MHLCSDGVFFTRVKLSGIGFLSFLAPSGSGGGYSDMDRKRRPSRHGEGKKEGKERRKEKDKKEGKEGKGKEGRREKKEKREKEGGKEKKKRKEKPRPEKDKEPRP